jgi:hypothetical protein
MFYMGPERFIAYPRDDRVVRQYPAPWFVMRRGVPLAPGIEIVTVSTRMSGRSKCAIAGSLFLTGCAIFEPEPAVHETSGQPRARAALKDDAWTAPVVTPVKPKVASDVRRAAALPPVASATPTHELGSCDNADQCALLLRLMVDDPNRRWITQRPSAAVYANGTRLFAYRALRAKLDCQELMLALHETQAAAISLNASTLGLTLDQTARIRTLNSQVEGELRAEHAERCKNNPVTSNG